MEPESISSIVKCPVYGKVFYISNQQGQFQIPLRKAEMFLLQASEKYFPVQIFLLQIEDIMFLENNSTETGMFSVL